jgi:hypothetical protein
MLVQLVLMVQVLNLEKVSFDFFVYRLMTIGLLPFLLN